MNPTKRQAGPSFITHCMASPWTLGPCQSNPSDLDPMPIQQSHGSRAIQPAFTSELLFTNEPLTTRAKIFHLLGHLDQAQSASRFSSINFWRDEYTLLKWLVVVIWTACNNSLQVLASKHHPAHPLLRASTKAVNRSRSCSTKAGDAYKYKD